MNKRLNGQEGIIKKLVLIVVAMCFVFIFLAGLGQYVGPQLKAIGNPTSTSNSSNSPYSTDYFNTQNPLLPDGGGYNDSLSSGSNYGSSNVPNGYKSPYAGRVTISSGNSSYSAQPYEEYVTIQNQGNPVNITGWTLTNGKGTRPIQNSGNSYFYPTADSATIGQGTEFLDPSGNFTVGSIVLKNGDNAIVTTGGPFSQFPFSIYTSFRENICNGYLENYPFEPQIYQSCPYPTNDPDIKTVTSECYDYIQSMSNCTNPEKKDKKNFDNLTSQCKAFISTRFNYAGCVARNQNVSGFASKQWRIFLGKKAQLWAPSRETITLYDKNNLIVDQISY